MFKKFKSMLTNKEEAIKKQNIVEERIKSTKSDFQKEWNKWGTQNKRNNNLP